MKKDSLVDKVGPAAEAGAPSYPISSVGNALRLLLLFREQQSVRLTEACAYLGVAHSTAHRLLAMLIQHGFVRQESSRAYRPGPMLVEIGLAVVQKMDVRMQARPFLEELAAEFGETVHLVILEGDQVRYVDAIESDRALRVTARTGQVLPAHCTSAGKALLGELTPAQVTAIYSDKKLTIKTTHSVRSFRALETALLDVRLNGFATNHEESEEGVGSVAIALVNSADRSVASIAVAVPESRLTPKLQAAMVKSLKGVRKRFSALSD
ncbi:IclR family transcriptional regulator [Pinirhizobacter sp.]|jgi:DNA-binding IclR family transcriptional regulator|uniref:IclR family transcriptional regulator n=1 Tax=Pinirhizobacter sp. TaxID=2950432 RepID=UPI002F3FA15F